MPKGNCDIHHVFYISHLIIPPSVYWFTRYASLASTILFLLHTVLFFWNRYELPALHAGLITSQSPRANIDPVDDREVWIDNNNNIGGGGTETTASSFTFIPQPQPYPVIELGSPMRSAVAAASTSLQSIRSLASIHSLSSLAERTPNLLFHGGYNLNDSIDTDGEDSYIERVGRSGPSDFNSFHHHNSWKRMCLALSSQSVHAMTYNFIIMGLKAARYLSCNSRFAKKEVTFPRLLASYTYQRVLYVLYHQRLGKRSDESLFYMLK